jgi:hypothetical protein
MTVCWDESRQIGNWHPDMGNCGSLVGARVAEHFSLHHAHACLGASVPLDERASTDGNF